MTAIHSWRLDVPGDATLLSDDERLRAARFATPTLAARFVAARAGLRTALGTYLGADPKTLAFAAGPHGKPTLDPASVEFNLSHSGDLAMVAISDVAPLGLDIERLRAVRNEVVQRFFSPLEQRCAAAWDDPKAGFCAVWTAKEAVMKGLGLGFALPLTAFEVDTPPGAAPRLIRLDPAYDHAEAWSLRRIGAPQDYFATLAERAPIV